MEYKITLFKVHMPKSVIKPLKNTLLSGFIGQGPKVEEFENILGNYIGNKYVLTLNSCTSAIQLALRLCNVGFGDEVISTAMTCTATNEPILALDAKIIWADINPTTGNIDPKSIKNKITNKTKAIIAMHWGGYPPDLKEINIIAKEYGIKVIEDAAHAFGAEYQGQKIGNHSDFVCFSFQAIKHINTVDGGALFCKSEEDYKRGKLLRWYGIDREEKDRSDHRLEKDIKEYGYKFHMNDVCATIGIEQMKFIDKILEKNRANINTLNNAFQNNNKIKLLSYKNDRLSAYWLYTILIKNKDDFKTKMNEKGIMVSPVHARNDSHTMFQEFRCELPNVDKFYSEMICIPSGWWLKNEEIEYIIKTINEGW
ncbi:DegT/DnrJ/EryC1/StrS family aminotransferase [Candidatus Woesearchaeota archaeon]|nr:DegT/DnrJ/EryC1/StrS family aminotransferase [Candidatus Woesearchaeota archaeon]